MTPLIVLVVAPPFSSSSYLSAVATCGGTLATVSNTAELLDVLATRPVNGILLDVPSMVRASAAEKAFIHDLIQIYPSVRLKWDPRRGEVKTLFYGQGSEAGGGLAEFVTQRCAAFIPRIMRHTKRVDLNLNVLVSEVDEFHDAHVTRSVTLNVSQGGCFLFWTDELAWGSRLWLRIMELADQTPLGVEVRWQKTWGSSPGMCGVGVRFLEITDAQRQEIVRRCDRDRFG